jgi:CTP:molybdopterin cytidylyltransferase MocA
VLNVPRVGFFSTPAFFANWQTNTSNQMRVTLNQALIVALGSSVDGTDATVAPGSPPPGLEEPHASPPACYSCHRTLDPTRSILSANYSWNYHNQNDSALTAQNGIFAFRGVIQPVNSLDDFGRVLGSHPLFASAWAQKLCYYVNSAACASDDPEFLRIVDAFKKSGYQFNTLVAELLASPIITRASRTAIADGEGEVIAVSRRDHLCAALNERLGLTDVCALDATTRKQGVVPSVAAGLPSDGYGRGSVTPVLPNAPTLFYRAGVENICTTVAAQVIDVAKPVPGVKQWASSNPDAAIADFVSTVMALTPSDPRASASVDLLKAHFAQAKAQGATASDALKSTFAAACLAPSSISMGL